MAAAHLRRVVIIRNPTKAAAEITLEALVAGIGTKAEVLATGVIADTERLAQLKPDRIIVLGGDGSILAAARALGAYQVPIVGVNFGKLGFLAEFSAGDVCNHLDAILGDPGIISRRMMIEASVTRDGRELARSLAVNDCVIHAGPPYRMIALSLSSDGVHLTDYHGDGLVLATPCGSTAHNMSVGGPILQSKILAIILTPISPHSLTHRPLVVAGDSVVEVVARVANEGTMVVIDGQVPIPLHANDRLTVRRAAQDFLLVHNPTFTRHYALITKLKWGR